MKTETSRLVDNDEDGAYAHLTGGDIRTIKINACKDIGLAVSTGETKWDVIWVPLVNATLRFQFPPTEENFS